jgi:hypothetical protein
MWKMHLDLSMLILKALLWCRVVQRVLLQDGGCSLIFLPSLAEIILFDVYFSSQVSLACPSFFASKDKSTRSFCVKDVIALTKSK